MRGRGTPALKEALGFSLQTLRLLMGSGLGQGIIL
jgi:hypothetical protein